MLQFGVENVQPWMMGPLQVAVEAAGVGGHVCIPWVVAIPATGAVASGYIWFVRQRELMFREMLAEARAKKEA